MNMPQEALRMRQLLVFGGGLTPEGQLATESVERTMTAVDYVREYGAYIGRVVFTGGRSILTPDIPNDATEGHEMAKLFHQELPDEAERLVKVESEGRTSIDNIVRAEASLLDMPVGRVTHRYHQPRTQMLTDVALYQPTFTVNAQSERPDKVPLSEYVLRAATRGLLFGVENGDMAKLAQRAELEAALFSLSPQKIVKATLFRYHTSIRG
jgi:hypothetical protein